MHMIKNREIFLVQIATRPFSKHIYMSLRALLNSTLTRNEFESFQTQPIHKIEGSKPCIYTFYTKTIQIPYSNPYKTLDFHTRIHTNIHSSIPMILFSLSSFFSFILFFFPSLLFSLIRFCSLFLQDQMRYLFWSYPYLILSLFYFTFSLFWSILDHPVKGGSFLPLSFKPLVSSTIFFLISF